MSCVMCKTRCAFSVRNVSVRFAVLALALVHHLAISNNLPLGRIAEFLNPMCRHLIIEFVPKSDSQGQRLLESREDIFAGYARQAFEAAFSNHFTVLRCETVQHTDRILYLMESVRR